MTIDKAKNVSYDNTVKLCIVLTASALNFKNIKECNPMKTSKLISVAMAAAVAAAAAAVPASAEGTYHAYIGVQSASYTFRNAWNEPSYGQGVTSDDGMVYFDQLTGWDESNNAVNKGGVFTDAEITGDGEYSVSVTDFDFGSDETLNLLFVSTDIPLDAGVTISNVQVVMDGNTKHTFDEAFLSPDETTYMQPMAINIWNSDLGGEEGLFGYVMPADSIEIKFTVSGMGGGAEEAPADDAAAEEAPAEDASTDDAPASDSVTDAAQTGNSSAAVIAAAVAAAGAAAVLSRKRK